jgi:hypothetical protein
VQLKSMPIKPFNGDQDDIDRILRGCNAHFRSQRIYDDLDRIYAAGMMLEGRPAKWFGTYLCKISPKEAARHHVTGASTTRGRVASSTGMEIEDEIDR